MMEKTKLRVDGMVCGHCEIAVQDAVRKLPGIKKDASLVSLEQIVETINATGYRVIP